jgi:N-methylhydantoinase A
VPDAIRIAPEAVTRPNRRKAYFGAEKGWIDVPVLARSDLARGQPGPCIVEEYDATCVVPADAEARLDSFGNIVIDLAQP